MNKISQVVIFLLMLSLTSQAQSIYGESVKADIKMKYVYTFEEALKLSKETGKPIFFNCFADWAVPCHAMNKKVFSDQNFADWMDKNFINFFTDVTKGDGRTLATKYNVKTMAHYLVLDSSGEVLHRIVGGSDIPEFKKQLQNALNPKKSLRGMNKQFDEGDRKIKFLREYFDVLLTADENEKAKVVLDDAFLVMKQKDWSKKENWTLFTSKTRKTDDIYFKYLIDNQALFAKSVGSDKVKKTLSIIICNAIIPYMLGSATYDSQKMLDLYFHMQNANLSDDDNSYIYYSFAKYRGDNNIGEMINILKNQGQTWDPNMLRTVDLSLASIEDFSPKDKEILTAYWQERANYFEGVSTQNHYLRAIEDLNSEEGILFENLSLQQALDKAGRENKLVFMDCYTVWCGPCKWMDRNTFKDEAVGKYFSDKFVSIKVDMEVGEGNALRERYEVMAFPTMLILDSKGEIVYRMVGAHDSEKFMNIIGEIMAKRFL